MSAVKDESSTSSADEIYAKSPNKIKSESSVSEDDPEESVGSATSSSGKYDRKRKFSDTNRSNENTQKRPYEVHHPARGTGFGLYPPYAPTVPGRYPSFGMPHQVPSHSMVVPQPYNAFGRPPHYRPHDEGIFDDADEDVELEFPEYKPRPPPPPPPPPSFQPASHPQNNPPNIRADLIDAILGSSPKGAPQYSMTFVPPKPSFDYDMQPPAKRSRQARSTKKVLVAKREQESAEETLRGKTDLMEILDEKDCFFLGEKLWIFCLEQLECCLTNNKGEGGKTIAGNPRDLRAELVEALSCSSLILETSDKNKPESGDPSNPNDNAEKNEKNDELPQKESDATMTDSQSDRLDKEEEKRAEDDQSSSNQTGSKTEPDTLNPDSSTISAKETVPSKEKSYSIKAAEKKIVEWQECIEKWRESKDKKEISMENQFPLRGPLFHLFPKCLKNFFKSTSYEYIYEFLCLKKTETGSIIDYIRIWRRKCGLPELGALPIAKHLLGVNLRIETAITSIPAADADTREWMIEPLVVLSGAAKDFIITESRIFSASDFIDRRTKDLSNSLVEWRESNGLPPLKGTGKVAMISAWKALVKEAMDVEAGGGDVLQGIDFEQEVEVHAPFLKDDKKAKVQVDPKKNPSASKKSTNPEVQNALRSPSFLTEIFDTDKLKLMTSAGVSTARQLLDAENNPASPLVNALMHSKPDAITVGGSVQPSSCVRLICDWCDRVKQRLAEIEEGKTSMKAKKPKQVRTVPKPPVTRDVPNFAKRKKGNPFDKLSTSTVEFLATMGITTAEGFLTTRTTDVASAFIAWREQKNMSVLKGLGAVASVSGWKAQIRKAARDYGMTELAAMEPGSGNDSVKSSKTTSSETKPSTTSFEKPTIKDTVDRELLFGQPRRQFAVRPPESKTTYSFELSVRKCPPRTNTSLYLTYLGPSKSDNNGISGNDAAGMNDWDISSDLDITTLPILIDVPYRGESSTEGQTPFSTHFPGLGTIELSRYGVQQYSRSDDFETLKSELVRFINNESEVLEEPASEAYNNKQNNQVSAFNIFSTKYGHDGRKYYLCLKDPIEKGQSVELQFAHDKPTFGENNDTNCRLWMQEKISQLGLRDLRPLLDFIHMAVGESVDQEVRNLVDKNRAAMASGPGSEFPIAEKSKDILISRRRIHWVILKMNNRLKELLQPNKNSSITAFMPPATLDSLWKRKLVSDLKGLTGWNTTLCPALRDEAEREILAEFATGDSCGFATARGLWCPMAEKLFKSTIELLRCFLIELEDFRSTEQLVGELTTLVSDASKQVSTALSTIMEGDDDDDDDNLDMQALVLAYDQDYYHISASFPLYKEVACSFQKRVNEDGKDPTNSNEETDELNATTVSDLRVIATVAPVADDAGNNPGNESLVTMSPTEDAKNGSVKVNLKWYIENQVLAVVNAAVVCALDQLEKDECDIDLNDTKTKLQDAAQTASGDQNLQISSFRNRSETDIGQVQLPSSLNRSNVVPSSYQPSSSQFFLGLIWPILRATGWKMEAGLVASDLLYFPPGKKRRDDSHARMLKQERAKQRQKLARQTGELGLGFISKPSKRLLVNTSRCNEEKELSWSISVKDASDQFLMSLFSRVPDEENKIRLKAIVSVLLDFFDELAPMLLYEGESIPQGRRKNERPCEKYQCNYLMRLLLVLPNILHQSGLPLDKVEDTLGVVRELTNYISNHHEFFHESFRPPKEQYHTEYTLQPFTVPRLLQLKQKKKGGGTGSAIEATAEAAVSEKATDALDSIDDNIETILDCDRGTLTDFVETVMDQIVICRASHEDVGKKNRRIFLGFPGLMCRHCQGIGGEGKYFFSTIESVTTAATVVEKHIAKCPKIPAEIKKQMVEGRKRHHEQRKTAPQGAQSAFFARLWKRLRSSKALGGGNIEAYVSSHQTNLSTGDVGRDNPYAVSGGGGVQEFKSHISLIEYLVNNSPWNTRSDLMEAIEQYYSCLEYGGRIYNTNAMPPFFNSEWLLSKVAQSRFRL